MTSSGVRTMEHNFVHISARSFGDFLEKTVVEICISFAYELLSLTVQKDNN